MLMISCLKKEKQTKKRAKLHQHGTKDRAVHQSLYEKTLSFCLFLFDIHSLYRMFFSRFLLLHLGLFQVVVVDPLLLNSLFHLCDFLFHSPLKALQYEPQ